MQAKICYFEHFLGILVTRCWTALLQFMLSEIQKKIWSSTRLYVLDGRSKVDTMNDGRRVYGEGEISVTVVYRWYDKLVKGKT